MKNNQSSLSQKQLKREIQEFLRNTRELMRRYYRLRRAKTEIDETAKWLQRCLSERQEPSNIDQHMHIDELIEGMLKDYARLIGYSYICHIAEIENHE